MKKIKYCIKSIKVFDPNSGMSAEFKDDEFSFFENNNGIKVCIGDGFTFYPWHTIRSYSAVIKEKGKIK